MIIKSETQSPGPGERPAVPVEPRWVNYAKIRWNPAWCKRCGICVAACPKRALVLRDDAIVQIEGCDETGICQMLCPDLAIELIRPRQRKGSH